MHFDKEYYKNRDKVICVDFDGTIAEYDRGTWKKNEFGLPIQGASEAMKSLRELGYKLILFTCRNDTNELRQWLKDNNFEFDGINSTEFNYPETSNKPSAEFYIDDHNLRFDKKNGWRSIVEQVKLLQSK